jgi:hypothetical protein
MFSYFSPVNNNNVNGVEFQFDCKLFNARNTRGYFLILLTLVSKMQLEGRGSRGPALIICHGPRETLIQSSCILGAVLRKNQFHN